jgi:integrase
VKTPKRLIVPLSIDEVHRFWHSFRNSRDLAIVGLMVLHGLRSCEVLALNREDLQLAELQIRILGKGKKIRVLPLDQDSVKLLDHYLYLERPPQCGLPLFVSLKGPSRGHPMTAAGRRSLFRHHRQSSGVRKANPHRFRHTSQASSSNRRRRNITRLARGMMAEDMRIAAQLLEGADLSSQQRWNR